MPRLSALAASLALALPFTCLAAAEDLTRHVDPLIGTDAHGHTFPGPCMPFGMIQLSPDSGDDGWDWCSGYHRSSKQIAGFSHTHLSGTGCPDLGDISFMPTTRTPEDAWFKAGAKHVQALRADFSHDAEKATVGHYQVLLPGDGITVELAASLRAGWHRYTFPAGKPRNVVIDLGFAINNDRAVETGIRQAGADTVTGFRFSKGWAAFQKVYFAARFAEPIAGLRTWLGKTDDQGATTGKEVKAALAFAPADQPLLIKVALSSVSEANALANLTAEPAGFDLDAQVARTRAAWNKILSTITVETPDADQAKVFYTAMYHASIHPSVFSDVDGRCKGFKNEPVENKGFTTYTVLSLWDTFRALMPLMELTFPAVTNDTIKSGLSQFRQTGQLPIWELVGNETHCMIGHHAIPVMASAMLKGIGDFDQEEAWKAMVAAADDDRRGGKAYRELGYIPCDQEKESVSKLLEYCYDDWCMAQVAKKLGKADEQVRFLKRSGNWRNVFDAKLGFMRGKKADGTWQEPFNPRFSDHHNSPFTEGNAWQWLWFVPHDPNGLIEALGGKEAFVTKLDRLFSESSVIEGANKSLDISGLIGQYAHGNEPSHHTVYFYNIAGRPDRTQERARQIVTELYTAKPDGLCGNDDCGQMSAWYVFNALGFYPMDPVLGEYQLGSPLFPKAQVNLPNGKQFTVIAEGTSAASKYVQNVTLNGQGLGRSHITYAELMAGGELRFTMGAQPAGR